MNKEAITQAKAYAKAIVGRLEKIEDLADSCDAEMHDEDMQRLTYQISDLIGAVSHIGGQ